jgi:hypothetical protein
MRIHIDEIDYSGADGDVVAARLGDTLAAGDTIDYAAADTLGDMNRDSLSRGLAARGLRLDTGDTDYIEVVAAE